MRYLLLAAILLPLYGQQPEFEVATVKLSGGGGCGMRGGPGTSDPTHICYSGFPLRTMMVKAFDLHAYQILGPEWLDDTIYAIQANLPPGTTKEQFQLMFQSLLRERLGMTFHREKKEFTVYDLVVAKNGPLMTSSAASPGLIGWSPRSEGFVITGSNTNMAGLAMVLERQALHSPVVDKTGLTGNYSFKIQFDTQTGLEGVFASLPAALSDIGLKLEKSKAMLDVVVMDTINKVPKEN